MSFKALKKNKQKLKDKIVNQSEKDLKGSTFQKDERFFELERDSDGTGSAVIRFLPPKDEDSLPYVHYYNHGFKTNKGWFIENCPTTKRGECPVCESNNVLYEKGDKETVTKRKRKRNFVSNILVVDDPKNPENNGKVFLYRYGVQIFEMINECMHPKFEDSEAFIPFDFWEGANFRLRVYENKSKFPQYDKCSFDEPAALSEDDGELEEIYNKLHDIEPFVADEQFKSYEELKREFNRLTEGGTSDGRSVEDILDDDDEKEEKAPKSKTRNTKNLEDAIDDDSEDEVPWKEDDDDDESVEDYFATLKEKE